MSHLQTPHKSFARYASVLRENLIACDTSLRKGEEDWHATLGRLNAAFNQTKNLNDVIDNSYEHVVYIPKKCTANVQDISSFLSCRCTPDSIVSSSSASSGANQGGQGGMMKHNEDDSTKKYTSAGRRVIEGGQDDDNIELGEVNKAQTASELLGRYEQKVFALASEFEEGMVRF